MRVEEPPYDLIALLADQDANQLVSAIFARGEERGCVRPFRWRTIVNPRRDTAVVREAHDALRPFYGDHECRYVVVWDHDGSGRETDAPESVERSVIEALTRAGVPEERAVAISFRPEVEASLVPAWSRVCDVLAQGRDRAAPTEAEVLPFLSRGQGTLDEQLATRPKEVFDATLRALNLRHSPALFEALGQQVSLPLLKTGDALQKLTGALVRWFPPED